MPGLRWPFSSVPESSYLAEVHTNLVSLDCVVVLFVGKASCLRVPHGLDGKGVRDSEWNSQAATATISLQVRKSSSALSSIGAGHSMHFGSY